MKASLAEQRAALEWIIRTIEGPLLTLEGLGHAPGAGEQLKRVRAAIQTLAFVEKHQEAIRRAAGG